MASFEYTGQLASGRAISGTFEADRPEQAQLELEALPVHIISLSSSPAVWLARPLSREDLQFFNNQLASMAESGIALDQGLRILARDLKRGRLRDAIAALADDLEHGIPFDEAVARRKGLFPPLYVDVLRAGIRNGRLGSTLLNMNAHFELMGSARRFFWDSATYPLIIITMGFVLVWIFMRAVVPRFEEMFAELAANDDPFVPFPHIDPFTALLFSMSRHWTSIALGVLVGAGGLAAAIALMGRFESGRSIRDRVILLLPGLGRIHRASLVSRFAHAAALGARSGQDLPAMFRLAAGATGHEGIILEADRIASSVEAGAQPIETATRTRIIPAIFAYTAQVAGARGQLASALAELARTYDELARHRMTLFKMILMPVLVVLTAIVIGGGIMLLFLPMARMLDMFSSFM